jgi:BolA family transcriptional regulator, general stress-responsive regulator
MTATHSRATATAGGPVQTAIEAKLNDAFAPVALLVVNESYMHSVPPGSESHFKVVVVSDAFTGRNLVARHRAINAALAAEIAAGIHALSIEARTPQEWEQIGGRTNASPKCLGGGASR